MLRRACLIGLAAAAIAIACSDPPPRPPVAGDLPPQPFGSIGGGGGGGGSSDASARSDGGGDDAGGSSGGGTSSCTDLQLTGAAVEVNNIGDNPPNALGGQIQNGTYDLVEATRYTGLGGVVGPSGSTYRQTIRVTDNLGFERVQTAASAGGAAVTTASRGSIVLGAINANAAINLSCPTGSPQEGITYSAQGDSLTMTDNTSKVAFTYSKRP